MGILTADKPKALVEVLGETIIGRQISILSGLGIREYIITTGYFPDKIESFCRHNFPGLFFKFVHNRKFAKTHTIYTMHLVSDILRDDILLLHGDLVFDHQAAETLLLSKNKNTVMTGGSPLEKDMKAKIEDDMVTEVGVDLIGQGVVRLLPFYKLSKTGMRFWLRQVSEYIKAGEIRMPAENALSDALDEILMKPLPCPGFCMSIITKEDLEKAEQLLA